MPFYISDFRGHPDVRMMDFYERALYTELLMACWQADDHSIPDDRVRLARMVGLPEDKFNDMWPFVRDRFVESQPGRLTHPRIARDKEKVLARAKAGKDAADKRWSKKKPPKAD
jgi:uncharacterized protein YdaU (DUF1376 family)